MNKKLIQKFQKLVSNLNPVIINGKVKKPLKVHSITEALSKLFFQKINKNLFYLVLQVLTVINNSQLIKGTCIKMSKLGTLLFV